ncbi:serine hydrolase [Clostridium weizhouense]|uniref:Class A beta-lactamase-related serine hydrolase n=1 Tax=Clostridium weizhouense TaxID=2859781 RepID=A0ABS7ANR5_9CLOT|nr:serine hydrolase [Clostridium weizhouense]MBW6409110.1 class A beta-lactamase-related serine hydrolase [Clostridium weizhouense]
MRIIKKYFILIIIISILIVSLLFSFIYIKSRSQNFKIDTDIYKYTDENNDNNTIDSNSSKNVVPTKLTTGISISSDLLNSDLTENEKLYILNNNKYNLEDRISLYLGTDKEDFGFIYYDLNSDKYIKFNENDTFIAASTYKVSLNLLAYEKVKQNKDLLNIFINYKDKYYEEGTGILQDLDNIPPMKVQDLLDLSIINSDNIATNMVGDYLGGHDKVREQVWDIFNIPLSSLDNITTPESELKILKHIYDNKDDSNYAHLIKVLQSTDTHTRIDKYIPKEIVAHKIGSSNDYIHDIGIITCENPYILIVYTKGLDDAEEKIGQVSKAVYNYQINFRDPN